MRNAKNKNNVSVTERYSTLYSVCAEKKKKTEPLFCLGGTRNDYRNLSQRQVPKRPTMLFRSAMVRND